MKLFINDDGLIEFDTSMMADRPSAHTVTKRTKSWAIERENGLYPVFQRSKFIVTQLKKFNQTESLLHYIHNTSLSTLNHGEYDEKYIFAGLGVYQDMNEDETWAYAYLRNAKWRDIEKIQWIIHTIQENSQDNEIKNKDYTIKRTQQRGYIYVDNLAEDYSYDVIYEMIQEAIENNNVKQIVSFIVGIIIAWYARVQTTVNETLGEFVIKGIVLQIPVDNGLRFHSHIIDEFVDYITMKYVLSIDKDYIYQIGFHDWELEEMVGKVLLSIWFNDGCTDSLIVLSPKRIKALRVKSQLIEFMNEIEGVNDEDKKEFMHVLDEWALKLITR